MSMDFPRAWEIVRDSVLPDHHPECSYRTTGGAVLCDCDILTGHPEYSDMPLHTRGGVIFEVKVNPLG